MEDTHISLVFVPSLFIQHDSVNVYVSDLWCGQEVGGVAGQAGAQETQQGYRPQLGTA